VLAPVSALVLLLPLPQLAAAVAGLVPGIPWTLLLLRVCGVRRQLPRRRCHCCCSCLGRAAGPGRALLPLLLPLLLGHCYCWHLQAAAAAAVELIVLAAGCC
jgi:hypothetical protein